MNADGSGQTQLTFNGPNDEPSWSPDGTKIVFELANGREIIVMNADGTAQTNLTNDGGWNSSPDWSPDGTKIAYHVDVATRFCAGNCDVFVMNANGSGKTNLTNNAAVNEGFPAWSPDGTKIAFLGDRAQPNNADIYVMNADGSAVTRLTDNPAAESQPAWQPLHYTFSGFFQPVDNPGPGPGFVFNVAKAGSAIPVKFSLNGDQGLSIFAPGYPKSQPVSCDASAPYDGIEETVTAGSSSLSYDATADQYTYVWKTDKLWASTCRKLTVRLNDSTDHVAYFNFKK